MSNGQEDPAGLHERVALGETAAAPLRRSGASWSRPGALTEVPERAGLQSGTDARGRRAVRAQPKPPSNLED